MKRLFFILFVAIVSVSNAQEVNWLTDFEKAKKIFGNIQIL